MRPLARRPCCRQEPEPGKGVGLCCTAAASEGGPPCCTHHTHRLEQPACSFKSAHAGLKRTHQGVRPAPSAPAPPPQRRAHACTLRPAYHHRPHQRHAPPLPRTPPCPPPPCLLHAQASSRWCLEHWTRPCSGRAGCSASCCACSGPRVCWPWRSARRWVGGGGEGRRGQPLGPPVRGRWRQREPLLRAVRGVRAGALRRWCCSFCNGGTRRRTAPLPRGPRTQHKLGDHGAGCTRAQVHGPDGALLWRGLRVRIGMAWGLMSSKKPLATGEAAVRSACVPCAHGCLHRLQQASDGPDAPPLTHTHTVRCTHAHGACRRPRRLLW